MEEESDNTTIAIVRRMPVPLRAREPWPQALEIPDRRYQRLIYEVNVTSRNELKFTGGFYSHDGPRMSSSVGSMHALMYLEPSYHGGICYFASVGHRFVSAGPSCVRAMP